MIVDINGGWFDSGNLIAGGSMDLGGGSDTILEIVAEPNTTLQNWLVRFPTYKYIINQVTSYLMWDS